MTSAWRPTFSAYLVTSPERLRFIFYHLQLDPTSEQLFLFRNRDANKIKMLCWDKNGFWLCYKRLGKSERYIDPENQQISFFDEVAISSSSGSLST
jgi:transposase